MIKIWLVLSCYCFVWQAEAKRIAYNLVEDMPSVYITPLSEKIGHTWTNGYIWDKPLIQKFYKLLAAHESPFVVFDLGAQTGSFSLLSKFLPYSTWYSFEPIEEAANTLRENLKLNGIKNVQVYQKAAAEKSGTTILQMPDMGNWGLSTLGSNVLRFSPIMQRTIECIDLDTFVEHNNISKVHYMKLDTEGYEIYILRGAKQMIERDHPIILMEYNETNMKQCGASKQDIDSFLQEMGYEWKLISSEDILCVPKV